MDCEDPTSRISCQLDRIADAATGFDGLAFGTQVLATFLGLLVPVLIAYFVFRGERRVRQVERRDDAFVRVIEAISQYSADLWHLELALKASKVAGAGNMATNAGQFDPPPPTLDRVEQAIAAAKLSLRDKSDLKVLAEATGLIKATNELEGWKTNSGVMTAASNVLSDAVRSRK